MEHWPLVSDLLRILERLFTRSKDSDVLRSVHYVT